MLIALIIALSLSTDTFSLSLIYGTSNLDKRKEIILSITVGLFHFFMPLLGQSVGKNIIQVFPISLNFLVFIIFLIIGVEMILESFKKYKKIKELNLFEILAFAFAVSIDSFTVGIGLKLIFDPLISSFIFLIVSAIFTYLGLYLGKLINLFIGKISTIIGGLVLIIIGILYII